MLAVAAYARAQTGRVHTADVDLAYWMLGPANDATPVIAVNGGPGLSHVYMVQNDVLDAGFAIAASCVV